MSAAPAVPSGDDDEERRPADQRTTSLSMLEEALREALACASREQVLDQILVTLPEGEGEAGDEAGFHGRVSKVSVSMPADLTAAVKRRTGAGGFSRYVTEAVQDRIRHDLLGEFLDELDAEYGPIPPEIEEQTRLLWPDESP